LTTGVVEAFKPALARRAGSAGAEVAGRQWAVSFISQGSKVRVVVY